MRIKSGGPAIVVAARDYVQPGNPTCRAGRLVMLSFRGAPKARTRNPVQEKSLCIWIPGPPLRGVPE
jgi:hypothetical protein